MPIRKNAQRLQGYDYSLNGLYFITICTYKRQKTLSEIIYPSDSRQNICPSTAYDVGAWHDAPFVKLKPYGEICRNSLNFTAEKISVTITDFVIMPDHIHMIIWLNDYVWTRHAASLHNIESTDIEVVQNPSIKNVVGFFKMNVAKEVRRSVPETVVWQRGYYDHVIRNHAEYLDTARYIAENPMKWQADKAYP